MAIAKNYLTALSAESMQFSRIFHSDVNLHISHNGYGYQTVNLHDQIKYVWISQFSGTF